MGIKSRPNSAVVALVVIAAAVISCDKQNTSRSPTPLSPTPPPSPAVSLVRLELNAPASIAPGASAALIVNAIKSDGSVENVTTATQWSSSDVRVVTVNPSGVATAISPGEAVVTARYQGRASSAQLLVVPAGTFRLKGKITDSGFGLSNVTVTVLSGVGQGLTAITDGGGGYVLYGVRGSIVLHAKREGYVNRVETIDVNDNRLYDFEMVLDRARTDVRGRYALTLTRATCAGNVPDTRTYDATIDQNGPRLSVTLSGADFIVTRGHGNSFTGTVDGDRVQFSIATAFSYYYYYYYGQFDVIERLDSGHAFIVTGNMSGTTSSKGIAGTLNGSFMVAQGTAPPYTRIQSNCTSGSHRFEMTRR